MKDFIGIKCMFMVDGIKIEGVVAADEPTRILVKTESGPVIRVIKGKVSFFQPEREPEKSIPIQIVYCRNPSIKCAGVQYVAEGETQTREIFNSFMEPCPARRSDCKCGSRGDIRSVPSSYLKGVLVGMMFGDYPEAQKEKKDVKRKPQGENGPVAEVPGQG